MIGEVASSKKHPEINRSAVKSKQRCVDNQRDGSKLTCLIHGPGHSPDECKVLNDFGSKYTKIIPTK